MSHELGVEVDLAEIDAELKEYIRNGISEYFRRSVRAPLLERIGLILFPDTNTETANDLLKQLFTWAIPQLSTGVRRKAAHELLLTGGTLQDRRGRAAKHYRRKPVRNKRSEWTLHPETFRTGAKYEPAIREELGIILRDAARAGRGARAGLSDENNAADSYIPRPDMEQKYIKLPAQERQLALLYGDAGTGKSMLAKSVARHITFDEADILTLHAGSEDLLIRAMNDFIQRDQGDAPSGHKAIVAAEFAQLLTQPQAPRVVIIDNVADWQEARLLLPENLSDLRSFVIITSREQILPNGTGVALLVDNMTQPQAAAMVKDRVPSISDSDADSLATELDCRPLAIEHGCALIRQYKMQAQDFIAMLRADVVALFDAAPTTEMKLTAIYRRMIERISTDPSLVNATKLLGVLLVVEAMVDDTLVSNIWMELSKANERGSHSGFHMVQELALKSATQDLQRLALIQVEPEEDHNMLRMHDLTHSILHSLRVREIAEIAEAALRAVAETLDTEQWTLGDPLPHEWMHWTGSAERIFHSLKMGQTDADKAVFTSPPALHLSAFLLRTRRQWGSPCHQCMQRAARQHEQHCP